MNIKKIKAFTLSELLIVLMITALVVGLAFSILNLVQRQMYGIQNTLEKGTRLRQLHQSLSLDMNRFPRMTYSLEDQTLLLSNPLDSVRYNFRDRMIIKERDTFTLNSYDLNLFYRGEDVEDDIIDAIKVTEDSIALGRGFFIFKSQDTKTMLR